jgi:hypothetical protein
MFLLVLPNLAVINDNIESVRVTINGDRAKVKSAKTPSHNPLLHFRCPAAWYASKHATPADPSACASDSLSLHIHALQQFVAGADECLRALVLKLRCQAVKVAQTFILVSFKPVE